jgi:hypothetical protein
LSTTTRCMRGKSGFGFIEYDDAMHAKGKVCLAPSNTRTAIDAPGYTLVSGPSLFCARPRLSVWLLDFLRPATPCVRLLNFFAPGYALVSGSSFFCARQRPWSVSQCSAPCACSLGMRTIACTPFRYMRAGLIAGTRAFWKIDALIANSTKGRQLNG